MFKRLTTMFGRTNDDEPASPAEDTDTDTNADAEPTAAEPTELDGEPAEPAEPDGPDPAELDVRISELEDDIDSTESAVRAVQSSQEEMADSIDQMNETVRQLTGVYDRLMAEENPFMDGGQADARQNGTGQAGHDHAVDPADADASVIGFEDLDTGDDEPAAEPPAHESADDDADTPAAEQEAAATPEPDNDRPAVSTATPAEDPTPSAAPDTDNLTHDTAPADGGHPPMLETLPEGYAGEVLAMEWLGALMERSGPAGALRAVEHYEEVGWISPAVKRRLIDIIGGPSLDVFVDPMQPREPTGAEHQASHEYLTVLAELDTI
jgi:archaellum component FlaD/FlaE